MLAAKSNRGPDQGTPQALVYNSRLAVFSVAPIKLLECIFDEICNRLHPLLVGKENEQTATERGVASSKAGWAWACPINATKSADEGMWGPMSFPSQ